MATLAGLVQALPLELYNEVYEFTFYSVPGEHYIDRDYKPPSCLQVDRLTRNRFAQTYYGKGSIFCVSRKDCSKWLASLPKEHWRIWSRSAGLRFVECPGWTVCV